MDANLEEEVDVVRRYLEATLARAIVMPLEDLEECIGFLMGEVDEAKAMIMKKHSDMEHDFDELMECIDILKAELSTETQAGRYEAKRVMIIDLAAEVEPAKRDLQEMLDVVKGLEEEMETLIQIVEDRHMGIYNVDSD